jgi:pimeloyl-ACP methyl ester carboxylesterase
LSLLWAPDHHSEETLTIQQAYVNIGGARIHYLTAGKTGSPVILLHGGGIDSARLSWELLIPRLAARHRVFAPDFPGYGESERPDRAYTNESYIDFVREFLDASGIHNAALAGISMGGAVAIGFSLEHPQRVSKLVLVDSYGIQRAAAFHKLSYLFVRTPGVNALTWALMRNRPAVRYSLGALLKRPGSVTDELVEMAYQEVMRPNASRAWIAYQNSEITWQGTRTCYLDRLQEIQAPALIVHGTRDGAVPAECARQAQQRIRGSTLEWIEGAGHWPQRDDPETFNRVVIEYLGEA